MGSRRGRFWLWVTHRSPWIWLGMFIAANVDSLFDHTAWTLATNIALAGIVFVILRARGWRWIACGSITFFALSFLPSWRHVSATTLAYLLMVLVFWLLDNHRRLTPWCPQCPVTTLSHGRRFDSGQP